MTAATATVAGSGVVFEARGITKVYDMGGIGAWPR